MMYTYMYMKIYLHMGESVSESDSKKSTHDVFVSPKVIQGLGT